MRRPAPEYRSSHFGACSDQRLELVLESSGRLCSILATKRRQCQLISNQPPFGVCFACLELCLWRGGTNYAYLVLGSVPGGWSLPLTERSGYLYVSTEVCRGRRYKTSRRPLRIKRNISVKRRLKLRRIWILVSTLEMVLEARLDL